MDSALAGLVEIAEKTLTPGESIATTSVRDALERAGYTGVAVALALKMLARKDLVELSSEPDGHYNDFPAVRVSSEGWDWLEANQDKLVLTREPSPYVPSPSSDVQGNDIEF